MEPKITILLAKVTRLKDDFLNCHEIKNCGWVPNPLKFAVIIPLLAIELKATPNCNPTDDC